jgi:hypothetical protein
LIERERPSPSACVRTRFQRKKQPWEEAAAEPIAAIQIVDEVAGLLEPFFILLGFFERSLIRSGRKSSMATSPDRSCSSSYGSRLS